MAVRDAADRGYLVTLVEDACATHTPGTPPGPPGSDQGLLLDQRHPRPSATHAALGRSNPVNRRSQYAWSAYHHRPGRHHPRAFAAPPWRPWRAIGQRLRLGTGEQLADPAGPDRREQPLGQPRRPAPAARPEQRRVRVEQGLRRRCAGARLPVRQPGGNRRHAVVGPSAQPAAGRGGTLSRHGLQVIAGVRTRIQPARLPGERPAAAFRCRLSVPPGSSGWSAPLAQAGTEPEMFLPEYGQRQYGGHLPPGAGVAADRAVNVREVTREVARQMGPA